MPNWQSIEEAYARLLQVQEAFDNAIKAAIEARNAGSLPVLEILAHEVEQLGRAVLAAFGPGLAIEAAPDP
jgi:hypothetical protein